MALKWVGAGPKLVRMQPSDPHSFICSQLARGSDGGAIDLLSERWLDDAQAATRQDAGWQYSAWVYAERLADCVAQAQDPAVVARAGQLALRVLQSTLAEPDRAQRLNHESPVASGQGWLDAKFLCRAVAAARPAGVVGVLSAMLADAQLPLRARTHALLAYGKLGGRRHAHAEELVSALLSARPDPGFSDDGRLAALVQCGLVPTQRLCDALKDPASEPWFEEIVNTVHSRAGQADAVDLAQALLAGLTGLLQRTPIVAECLFSMGQALRGLTLSPAQQSALVQALKHARQQHAQADGSDTLAQVLERLLNDFGSGEAPPTREDAFAKSAAAAYLNHPATQRYLVSGFAGSTPVHTPAGLVRMDRLKAGDRVLGRKDEGGPVVECQLLKVHCVDDQLLQRCTLDHPDGARLPGPIAMTQNHPVWCVGRGWYAAGSTPDEGQWMDLSGRAIASGYLKGAYRTDQPGVGWFSAGRSRGSSLPGTLWDFTTQQTVQTGVPYDWERWDPEGSEDDADEHALYRGTAWDLVVQDAHSYFVGDAGLWVCDASLENGFRRQHAAQRVAFDAMFDETIEAFLAQRKVPAPTDVRDADGHVLAKGDAVVILPANRPGRVQGPVWVDDTVAWIAVDEGHPGRDTLVPVVGNVAAGLRRQAR